MGLGALRSVVWRAVSVARSSALFSPVTTTAKPELVRFSFGNRLIHSLNDTRYPKRRPTKHRRPKRATLKPPGPFKLVDYVPGEPLLPKPNAGSKQRKNEKKRVMIRKIFIMAEARKRYYQKQEADRKKKRKQVERKIAAVARDRAWVERLAELQRFEEEKKKATT